MGGCPTLRWMSLAPSSTARLRAAFRSTEVLIGSGAAPLEDPSPLAATMRGAYRSRLEGGGLEERRALCDSGGCGRRALHAVCADTAALARPCRRPVDRGRTPGDRSAAPGSAA